MPTPAPLNPVLFTMAKQALAKQMYKEAVVPPPGADPAMAGGAPPGAPPPAPGGAPPMDPAAAGGMPPGQMGGAPPMDPAMMQMMGGMMPGGMPGQMPGMPGAQQAPVKKKPEEIAMAQDMRMYNIQQQLTAIMNFLGVKVDPGVLILPPGMSLQMQPEAALPGGPQDPTQQGGGQQGGGQSSISPIQPIEGASPELAAAGGGGAPAGGGGEKAASAASMGLEYDPGVGNKAGALAALLRAANAGRR